MITGHYDLLDYPSHCQPQTHPNRLATVGTLFGMQPAGEHCRVLEVGCGNGLNLVAIALSMPHSRCTGIDLSARSIDRGRELVGRVGVDNVVLRRLDLLEVTPDLGEFDFIIAHGVYSWVPETIRDRLLSICRENLAPQGIAYVSYNALPGGHLRQMSRDMMLFHSRHLADPTDCVRQSRRLLQFLAKAHSPEHPIGQLLRLELDRLESVQDGQVFHDDLAPVNDAVYFDEFVRHAAHHRLQFLAEAELELIGPEGLPEWVQSELARLSGDDLIKREMYMDFLRDRTFRQTLLCRDELNLTRPPAPRSVRRLYVMSAARPVGAPSATQTFQAPNHAQVSTNNPLIKSAMVILSESWPGGVRFEELLERAGSRVKLATDEAEAARLAEALLKMCASGLVELHARAPVVVREPAQCPLASPLARVQAEQDQPLTTLNGAALQLADPLSRRLVPLLDGKHDRAELIDRLLPEARLPRAQLASQIDARILDFGRAGLLVQ